MPHERLNPIPEHSSYPNPENSDNPILVETVLDTDQVQTTDHHIPEDIPSLLPRDIPPDPPCVRQAVASVIYLDTEDDPTADSFNIYDDEAPVARISDDIFPLVCRTQLTHTGLARDNGQCDIGANVCGTPHRELLQNYQPYNPYWQIGLVLYPSILIG